ncbi:cytochrome P450 4F6-like [Mercenaria mercenaria]|uniref:cytochrome P450 4F6-like n=1 Tax=Mercenaria mercenaria TaxID=6596 RepID=UPI00234E84CE|nr:cytochrome P450 4F6-like [Mercenaria mercenaria]
MSKIEARYILGTGVTKSRFPNTLIMFITYLLTGYENVINVTRRQNHSKKEFLETHPYVQAVNDLATSNSERLRDPVFSPDIIFYRTKMGKKFKQDCDFVHSVAEDIMNNRRCALEIEDDVSNRKYLDFLDISLTAKDENGVGLSDTDIRNEVDTFLFEGYDTTASAISWILYSLAKHPEYQEKCQEEIDDLLQGRESDDIKWNNLPQLEYLSMCIKAGVRLYCPVAIVGRETTKPFDLGDITIPPGTGVAGKRRDAANARDYKYKGKGWDEAMWVNGVVSRKRK